VFDISITYNFAGSLKMSESVHCSKTNAKAIKMQSNRKKIFGAEGWKPHDATLSAACKPAITVSVGKRFSF